MRDTRERTHGDTFTVAFDCGWRAYTVVASLDEAWIASKVARVVVATDALTMGREGVALAAV